MIQYLQCVSPITIRNRYNGELLQVPCGKCAACRVKKAFKSKTLLDLEVKDFKYKVFFTLTYNDLNLPLFPVFDNLEMFDEKTLEYSSSFLKYHDYQVPYFSTHDFQLFIKDLRYEFSKHSDETLHYYAASEFGPTKFRPHAHGIFFFNSEWLSENIESIIPACWFNKDNNTSRGFVDVQFVNGNATNYVCQYVNCALRLPKILETNEFKPRTFSSRTSQEGSHSLTKEMVCQTIYSEFKQLTFWSYAGNSSGQPVSLWRNFEDRWFPKCKQFARLSDSDRLFMYRLSSLFGEKETFDDFYAELLRLSSQDSSYSASPAYNLIWRFFRSSAPDREELDVNSLRNAYYLSRRFRRNYEYLGTNIFYYIHIVVRYWSVKELENIHQFWQNFNEFVANHPERPVSFWLRCSMLVYDPLFLSNERHLDLYHFNLILSSFCYDTSYYPSQVSDCQSYLDNTRMTLSKHYDYILDNSHKNRSKNEFITEQILNYE